MRTIINTSAAIMACSVTMLLTAGPVQAVNCAKNPSHPNCGDPPPPPPPTGCPFADAMPGLIYESNGTRKSPSALYLASADGSRRALVEEGRRSAVVHLTGDGSAGVIIWDEDPENDNQYVVRRQDFTIKADGCLELATPTTLLPLPEEIIPVEDELYYFSTDIWGNAAHTELYLAVSRTQVINGGSRTVTRKLLIYNLNDPTLQDARDIPVGNAGCPAGVLYPQFVPGCYTAEGARWNTSGTRLYLGNDVTDTTGQRWNAVSRLEVDKSVGIALTAWSFSAPVVVYAGNGSSEASYAEPGGLLTRPPVAGGMEFIAMSYLDRTGKHTERVQVIMNADTCVDEYTSYAGGNLAAPDDLWRQLCLDTSQFPPDLGGNPVAWLSPDELLIRLHPKRRTSEIHRLYVSGPISGSALLIEDGFAADTGL